MSQLQGMITDFYPYAKKQLGFDQPISVVFVSDLENAKDPFGKTAYYNPGENKISLFVDERHPKDMLRSFSHELVHHAQNCNGQFSDIGDVGEGYAQSNPHLRKMEAEAYLLGNGFLVRDYEDSIKENIKMTEESVRKLVRLILEKVDLSEKRFANDPKLDKDGDGIPKWADKDDSDKEDEVNEEADADKKEREEAEEHFGKELANPKRDDDKEKIEEKYATSQDDEHADAQELGAKLSKKKKVEEGWGDFGPDLTSWRDPEELKREKEAEEADRISRRRAAARSRPPEKSKDDEGDWAYGKGKHDVSRLEEISMDDLFSPDEDFEAYGVDKKRAPEDKTSAQPSDSEPAYKKLQRKQAKARRYGSTSGRDEGDMSFHENEDPVSKQESLNKYLHGEKNSKLFEQLTEKWCKKAHGGNENGQS